MATRRLSSQDFEDQYLGKNEGGAETASVSASVIATARELGKEILKSPEVRFRELYDQAWEEVIEGIPDEMEADTDPLLFDLIQVKRARRNMPWVEIRGREVRILSKLSDFDPDETGGYIGIIPQGHEQDGETPITLMMRTPEINTPVTILGIRQQPITKRMAGFIQPHAVYSNMFDWDGSIQPEFIARMHEVKIALVKNFIGDAYIPTLYDIVSKSKLKDVETLVRYIRSKPMRKALYRTMDNFIFEGELALSEAERAVRQSFNNTLLLHCIVNISGPYQDSLKVFTNGLEKLDRLLRS